MTEKRARARNDAAPASPQGGLLVPVHEWTPERDAQGNNVIKRTWVQRSEWKPEVHLAKPLDFNQRGLSSWWDSIRAKYKLAVVNASRQLGKSFWACMLVTICALVNPGWQIKYGAKTQKHARGFIFPHFRYIRSLLPEDVRPKWKEEDQLWHFEHNDSTVTIAGCDKQYAETLTGQHAHLFVIDEGGAIKDLDFIIGDIALPQTLNTGGKLVIFSTPARSPGHAFKKRCDEAKAHGTYIERQIFDNPRLTDSTIREYCELAGGPQSTQWQREYLVQHVTESSAAVVPEATSLRMQRITITDTNLRATRSAAVDSYIVVVPEWNPNYTGVLWAHYDFAKKRIVVEDELLMPKLDTEELARALRERTTELWGENEKVFRVIAPNVEDDLICEMADLGWHFTGTSMKDFDTSNQKLRHAVGHRREVALWIHERCGDLRRQLEHAVWSDKKKREFERSKMDGYYPLLKAAVILREDLNIKHDAMAGDRRQRRFAPHAHRDLSSTGKVLARMWGLR